MDKSVWLKAGPTISKQYGIDGAVDNWYKSEIHVMHV